MARRHEFIVQLCFEPARLDFIVSPIVIGKEDRPNQTVVSLTPGPNLLPQDLPEVCHMHNAIIRLLVIGPEEIAMHLAAEERGGLANILVPAIIHSVIERE